jgi:hypothetical protein
MMSLILSRCARSLISTSLSGASHGDVPVLELTALHLASYDNAGRMCVMRMALSVYDMLAAAPDDGRCQPSGPRALNDLDVIRYERLTSTARRLWGPTGGVER